MRDLSDLEQRVTTRWREALTARCGSDPFDTSNWLTSDSPIDPTTPQLPHERWAIQPVLRTVVLLLCDQMLNLADQLTDQEWNYLEFLMLYGGKTQLS